MRGVAEVVETEDGKLRLAEGVLEHVAGARAAAHVVLRKGEA